MNQREWYEEVSRLPCPCCRAPSFSKAFGDYSPGEKLRIHCGNMIACGFETAPGHWEMLQGHISAPRKAVPADIYRPTAEDA